MALRTGLDAGAPYVFLFAPTLALDETFARNLGASARGEGSGVGIFALLSGDVGRDEGFDGEVGREDGRKFTLAWAGAKVPTYCPVS